MPERTSTDSRPVRLLPIAMPGPAAPAWGLAQPRLLRQRCPRPLLSTHGDPGTKARETCVVCSNGTGTALSRR